MSKKAKVRRLKKEERNNEKDLEEVRPTAIVTKNRLLCVILKSNGGSVWRWVNYKHESFRESKNTYFTLKDGIYISKNKVLTSVYLEGVCLPICHKQLDIKQIDKEYTNPKTGEKETMKVPMINNLKFDTEIIDILVNRKLADEFTRKKIDAKGTILIVGVVFLIVLSFINIGVNFL